MGLRTVLWKYDSDDWQFGATPGITSADVDNNYQKMINDADSGLFANVCGHHSFCFGTFEKITWGV